MTVQKTDIIINMTFYWVLNINTKEVMCHLTSCTGEGGPRDSALLILFSGTSGQQGRTTIDLFARRITSPHERTKSR
jgi:hypothetical protein